MTSRSSHRVVAALFFTLAMGGCSGDDAEPVLTENEDALMAFEEGTTLWSSGTRVQQDSAVLMYERAIDLDPEFVMAHVYLSGAQAWIHQNWDRSSQRAASTLASAERAVELAPDLPQAHSAMGGYYYRVAKDYDEAQRHYAAAQELAPEDPGAIRMTSYLARRAGRWDEAVELQLSANEITATPASLTELAVTYRNMGLFDEAEAALRQSLELNPERLATQSGLAWLEVYRSGDLQAVRDFLAERPSGYVGNRWWLAVVDGEYEAALAILDEPGSDPLSAQYGMSPRAMLRGLTYTKLGNTAEALASYQEAVEMMEPLVLERPDDPRTHLALGLSLAGAGRDAEAIEAGLTGVALMPPERDAMIGPHSVGWLAEIYSMVGEADLALEQLRVICDLPSSLTPAAIGLNPWLDGVRDHPDFEAILAGG